MALTDSHGFPLGAFGSTLPMAAVCLKLPVAIYPDIPLTNRTDLHKEQVSHEHYIILLYNPHD